MTEFLTVGPWASHLVRELLEPGVRCRNDHDATRCHQSSQPLQKLTWVVQPAHQVGGKHHAKLTKAAGKVACITLLKPRLPSILGRKKT